MQGAPVELQEHSELPLDVYKTELERQPLPGLNWTAAYWSLPGWKEMQIHTLHLQEKHKQVNHVLVHMMYTCTYFIYLFFLENIAAVYVH